MDTDVSQCPENSNSTDCLLRTLLQLLQEYRDADNAAIDWDPINFAFTLLIGAVAILFALATVTQAIFAAGKGRRRANHVAIGKWSTETKTDWDWSEMNFRVTATTPILYEESLLMLGRNNKTEDSSTDEHASEKAVQEDTLNFRDSVKIIASCFYDNQYQSRDSQLNHLRRPSAAWLEFFKEVGLDKFDIEAWGNNTRKVVADYLPDDVLAAPAYAQVGALVAAAATAGIHKVDIDKQTSRNCPILLGKGFQIEFRQHPALGIVGAYSRYDETSKELRRLNLEELRYAMKIGRGFFDDQKTMDLSTESTRRQLIERWSRLGEAHATSSGYQLWRATFALKLSAISEGHLPLIIGMFANRPEYVPALVPNATMRNKNCLTTLTFCGKYWAKVHLAQFRDIDVSKCCELEKTPSWRGFVWPCRSDRDSTLNSEIHELYNKLKSEKKDIMGERHQNLWELDIMLGVNAILDDEIAEMEAKRGRKDAERMEPEGTEAQEAEELQACVEEKSARRQAEAEERDSSERAQPQGSQAHMKEAIAGAQPKEKGKATAPVTQVEQETAGAEAPGAIPEPKQKEQAGEEEAATAATRQTITEKAQSPSQKQAATSDASVRDSTILQQETKAEATIGHCLVLQTCLEFIYEPTRLEKWFSEISSNSLRSLRNLVLEQIKAVDQWLHDKLRGFTIRHRSVILCNTTIVLLRVEQMIDEGFFESSGPEESQGPGVQGGSTEQQQTQSSHRERPEQNTDSTTHFSILQVLRNMVDDPREKARAVGELKKLLHNRSDSSLLWDRLQALVAYRSMDEAGWTLDDQVKSEKLDEIRDMDDVIIHRCIMMILLFRTAADSSDILESGIWDQIVPII